MNISRTTKVAAFLVGVGISAMSASIGAASAVPLDPPPSPVPGGPAMGTSAPPTTNITQPGVGPGGAHGGQNQTKAPGS